jgi:tRNA threonylcarbamoyladenosine biosynthesis protein TsaB
MRLLAIDTALEACSAAVLDTTEGGVVAEESQNMTRGHAEELMPLIQRVMNAAQIDFADLERIAVTIGPGSFTGMRVGIAAARGIGLAAGKPVVGLTTLSAYAAPFIAESETLPVVSAIDARHANVYLQVYGPMGRVLVAPRIASLHEAVLRASAAGAPRLAGTAAELLADAWPADERPPSAVDARRAPEIAWVARLGAIAQESDMPPKPLYLRAPDAQPQDATHLPRR